MPDFDGGHYFFTALVPVCNKGIVQHEAAKSAPGGEADAPMRSSPIHMVREALETLPTALQSHAAEEIGIQSPFARSPYTHFARFVVLDQPFYNGRDHSDALGNAIKGALGQGVDLLDAGPVDTLACPYLLVMIDFDPIDPSGAGEPRGYFEHLWAVMAEELKAVFEYCYGFSKVTDAAGFADFLLPCQIETTMPFNDYWVGAPPLKSMSAVPLLLVLVAALALAIGVTVYEHWHWWIAPLLALPLLAAGVAIDIWLIVRRAATPFPAAPDSTLRDVLKALYLQQAFTRFAVQWQGADPPALGAAFRAFLATSRPADLAGPTQVPGVIRSHFAGPVP
jgi:hypothetical protein